LAVASVGTRPGPGSLTWRCAADARGLLLAPAALILQVAHPVVGAAVAEHSDFTTEPWTRLIHTIRSVDRLVFGAAPVAAAEGRRLRRLHAGIRGVDPAGRPYHGLDPDAYAWVHLTLVRFLVDVQRLLGAPLTGAEQEALYLEWRQVGVVLGIAEIRLPSTWADFGRYFDDTVEHTLEATSSVQDVLAAVARPKKPFALLPGVAWQPVADRAGDLSLLLTIGTLPASLRARIGVSWTDHDQECFDRRARRLRTVCSLLPPPLRTFPPAMPYMVRAKLRTRSWPG
jgi:uncharacterized protein (DUF2236 family)